MKKSIPLSKSTLMRGMQCQKNLWLHLYQSNLEPKPDAATQMQFDEGNEVGELARKHFNGGELINEPYWEFEKAHAATQALIKNGSTIIFEAAFLVDGLFARADILKKDKNGWHLIEVKKSARVKDYHYQDAAVQTHIIELAGLKISSVSIMHINNKVTYPELNGLFNIEDITVEVRSLQKIIQETIIASKSVALARYEPKIKIGPQCLEPFECPFKQYCWKNVPEESVFALPNLHTNKKWELFRSGKIAIKDLDASKFKDNTRRAIEATKANKVFVDNKAIINELKKWEWPLYFFDFETLGPAIPRYNGTHPYDQIPFQFSCHVLKSPESNTLEHFEYLHTESSDPRAPLIDAMFKGFGGVGSIVAYNQSFEIGVIKKLIEFDKNQELPLLSLIERFVDPLPIFRAHVYHPEFLGSFSIKSVGPALIGPKLSYKNLPINDGGNAQAVADQLLKGKLSDADSTVAVANLLEYCRQDTLAMAELVKWLFSIV